MKNKWSISHSNSPSESLLQVQADRALYEFVWREPAVDPVGVVHDACAEDEAASNGINNVCGPIERRYEEVDNGCGAWRSASAYKGRIYS